MKNILLSFSIFVFVSSIAVGQNRSIKRFNIESRLLVSFVSNTFKNDQIGHYSFLSRPVREKLNAPIWHSSISYQHLASKHWRLYSKMGIGFFFNKGKMIDPNGNASTAITLPFLSVGASTSYSFLKPNVSIELEGQKLFYEFSPDIFTKEQGHFFGNISVSYPFKCFQKNFHAKLGYQYMSKMVGINLDLLKFSPEPEWAGIHYYMVYHHLISIGVSLDL